MSAIKPEWRHLRHVYAAPGQSALGQLGVKFAPQTVVIGAAGGLVAQRAPGVKGRLRGREIADLLLSLLPETASQPTNPTRKNTGAVAVAGGSRGRGDGGGQRPGSRQQRAPRGAMR